MQHFMNGVGHFVVLNELKGHIFLQSAALTMSFFDLPLSLLVTSFKFVPGLLTDIHSVLQTVRDCHFDFWTEQQANESLTYKLLPSNQLRIMCVCRRNPQLLCFSGTES